MKTQVVQPFCRNFLFCHLCCLSNYSKFAVKDRHHTLPRKCYCFAKQTLQQSHHNYLANLLSRLLPPAHLISCQATIEPSLASPKFESPNQTGEVYFEFHASHNQSLEKINQCLIRMNCQSIDTTTTDAQFHCSTHLYRNSN